MMPKTKKRAAAQPAAKPTKTKPAAPAAPAAPKTKRKADADAPSVPAGAISGHGAGVDSPAGRYDSLEALPSYHAGFAHPGAESYAIVPHDQEQRALDEGLSGAWENSRDGHFVVSVGAGSQGEGDEDEGDDEDEDDDEDDDDSE